MKSKLKRQTKERMRESARGIVRHVLGEDEQEIFDVADGLTLSEIRAVAAAKYLTSVANAKPDDSGMVDRMDLAAMNRSTRTLLAVDKIVRESGEDRPDVMEVKLQFPPPVPPDKPRLSEDVQRGKGSRQPTKVMK